MFNHHKRMIPKRDDPYRTEFPGNYYSSSSAYSCSPTSTSECPEHGRSRRRTTLILIISVVFATLGVLSIAGIAAYLGIISKNISNNASQYEESYLQDNVSSRSSSSSEEDDIKFNHGRSRHDPSGPGSIDLTNSLSDTKTGIESDGGDEELISPHRSDFEVSDHTRRKDSSTKPPEIINGTRMNLTLNSNPISIAARPVTVVVTSISATSTSATSQHDGNNNLYINPVDMIPPPTRGQENAVSYFTEESTSVKSFTKPPPRHNRNRHRYPLTNSHSLVPSTTTQINPNDSEEDKEEEKQLANKNVPIPNRDRDIVTTERNTSNVNDENDGESQSIVHVKPSDAKTKNHQVRTNNGERIGSINDDLKLSNQQNDENKQQNTFEDRKGLADGPQWHHRNNNKENEDDPQRATTTTHHQSNIDSNQHHTSTKFRRPQDNKKDEARPEVESTPKYFGPYSTPIISSEREDDASLINNHKMPLTFDRISPDFYDKNPWTPLLNRPNLDKRPRVDINNPITSTPSQPIIIWNTEDTNLSPSEKSPPQNYYGYGHSAPESSNYGNNNDDEVKDSNNGPISHGLDTDTNRRNHEQSQSSAVNQTMIEISEESAMEEAMGGFRPLHMPAYTVIIPHIPNPPSTDNLPSKRNESATIEANKPEDESRFEDGNPNSSFKMDRMGEAAVSDEKQEDEMRDVNVSNKNFNEQVEATIKNDAEEVKDEDYGEQDDITVDVQPEANIYRLDPDILDIVPDTLGQQNLPAHDVQDLKQSSEAVQQNQTLTNDSTITTETKPEEPDPLMKTTTDLIMSTLGSLNLIKPSSYRPIDIDSELLASDNNDSVGSSEEETETESPLFPPVRSYVGVNLPLRPKPTPAEGPTKQLRLYDEEEMVPMLRPDLTTASSLQKVLSMMMKFEGEETSRHFSGNAPYANMTRPNANLIISSENGSLILSSSTTDIPFNNLTEAPLGNTTTTHREEKSYKNRDSKIDEQFLPATNVEHVPVPLIVTESPVNANKSSKLKLSAVRVNDNNSPVYKFVLRKDQSVEDLLKEIFQNYTEVENDKPSSAPMISSTIKNPHVSNTHSVPSTKSLDVSLEEQEQTTVGLVSTTVKINHHVETSPHHVKLPLFASTSDPPILQTATSIVINEDLQFDYACPVNTTFRCRTTGRCIPLYLRCNFIKECPDNSDEENCSCADFLKGNGNGRKICDGILDCEDGSDEYENCPGCEYGQYICAGSRTCINRTQLCDGRNDCRQADDENDCVKIGSDQTDQTLGDVPSTYHKNGQLMVRKKGVWGKLCVETFSSVVSHWEVKDLARAVCKALTFSDFESVERVSDTSTNNTAPYYELFYGVSNNNETGESSESSSVESTPRTGLGFKKTECKSKLVVNVTCQDLSCGTAPRSFTQTARIVGGANSMPGKWPWQAALYKNGEYQCGATLISSRWLLSAGHCFYHAQDDHWVARLGTLRRGATVLSPYEQVVRITHIFLHPQYKDVGFVNDVSLLRLEKEVNFTDYVRPVCLPSRDTKIRDGRMCSVVGWGQLFEVGRVFPDTLQEVQLPLISTVECRKRTLFLPLYTLTDQMFCAGFDRGGRDACLGDSGGPLMCLESDGRYSLYGVTSNGYGCARAHFPGIFTDVSSHLDWIYETMDQDSSFVYRDKVKPCPGHRCILGECLDKRQVCDGIRQCVSGSDEANCTYSGHNS